MTGTAALEPPVCPSRFSFLAEAYSELDTRKARLQLLEALVAEFGRLAEEPKHNETLLRAQLLAGSAAALPFRSEQELARFLQGASQFLSLRILPILQDQASDGPSSSIGCPWGLCCAALAFHAVAGHLLQSVGPVVAERLLASGSEASAEDDRPLPASFLRRSAVSPGLAELMTEEAPLILCRRIPLSSPLLRAVASPVVRRRQPKEQVTPQGKRRRSLSPGDKVPAKRRVVRTGVTRDAESKAAAAGA